MAKIKKIIVLDDDVRGLAEAIAGYLATLGYTARYATNKDDWIKETVRNDFYPDLHILDHEYTGREHKGCDLISALRQEKDFRLHSARTILMSGLIRYDSGKKLFYIDGCDCRAIADLYIPKPFTLDDLEKTIKELENK